MKKTLFVVLLVFISLNLFAEGGFKDSIKSSIDKIEAPDEIKVFLIAMIPIFELRGAIPIGMLKYELPLWKVIPIALVGNMFPIFFILLFFDAVTKICFKVPFLRKILEAVFARTRSKTAVIQKYEEVGLMLFVAIPLPVTGAWTGSLAAYLLGLKFWKSIFFIFLGILIASVVVTFLASLKWIGAGIAATVLLIVFIVNLFKKRRHSKVEP